MGNSQSNDNNNLDNFATQVIIDQTLEVAPHVTGAIDKGISWMERQTFGTGKIGKAITAIEQTAVGQFTMGIPVIREYGRSKKMQHLVKNAEQVGEVVQTAINDVELVGGTLAEPEIAPEVAGFVTAKVAYDVHRGYNKLRDAMRDTEQTFHINEPAPGSVNGAIRDFKNNLRGDLSNVVGYHADVARHYGNQARNQFIEATDQLVGSANVVLNQANQFHSGMYGADSPLIQDGYSGHFFEDINNPLPISHLPFSYDDYPSMITSTMRRTADGLPISMVPHSIGSDVQYQDLQMYHNTGQSYFPNIHEQSIDRGTAHDNIMHVTT